MNPGTLRHRVTIEHPVTTQNEYGEQIPAWATFATVWASREDLTGREAYYAGANQKAATMLTRFTIRYLAALSEQMRIVSDARTYGIQSIADDGRREQLVILAERQADA
jgi:SPP1 family predicted phage head-tail adaptor